jgi:hypothetical protein
VINTGDPVAPTLVAPAELPAVIVIVPPTAALPPATPAPDVIVIAPPVWLVPLPPEAVIVMALPFALDGVPDAMASALATFELIVLANSVLEL